MKSNVRLLLAAMVLTVLAYLPSLQGPFLWDDLSEIRDNPAIRTLLPPWRPMLEGGELPHRPLPYFTFALNYAVHGLEPTGYHVVNIAIHLANGLLVWWIVRESLRRQGTLTADRADVAAVATAAVWLVHPLATQAVSYVYQRIELLAALAALGTLAAAMAARGSRPPWPWLAVSVACCAAGMGCKEWVIVVPIVVLLHDFACDGGWSAIRGRVPFYAALFATWGVLLVVLRSQAGRYPEAGFTLGESLVYAANQPAVIAWYLSRLVLPTGQSLDHGAVLETDLFGAGWPRLAAVAAFAAGVMTVVFNLRRLPVMAFLVVAFLLLLAPTSSLVPVHDVCVEHRMYLASVIPIAAATALIAHVVPERLFVGGATVVVLALALITGSRNTVYRSGLAAWGDAVAKSPGSSRALSRYGTELSTAERHDEAIAACQAAVRRNPRSTAAHAALAAALLNAGHDVEAAAVSRAGLTAGGSVPPGQDPILDRLVLYLGIAADRLGDERGATLLAEAVRRRP
jgi:protein O-mannosyl-transferase